MKLIHLSFTKEVLDHFRSSFTDYPLLLRQNIAETNPTIDACMTEVKFWEKQYHNYINTGCYDFAAMCLTYILPFLEHMDAVLHKNNNEEGN